MAEFIFSYIDPVGMYLVCNDNVTAFVTERITGGMSASLVNQINKMVNVPPRDFGIYRVQMGNDLPSHNSIDSGFVGYLVDKGVGVLKRGEDITLFEVHACTKMEVLLRLQAEAEMDA